MKDKTYNLILFFGVVLMGLIIIFGVRQVNKANERVHQTINEVRK